MADEDGDESKGYRAFTESPASQHEFNNPDRPGAHRLVATGMLITALIIAINQSWYKHAEGWVFNTTHPPGSPGVSDLKPPDQFTPEEVAKVFKWLIGLGGTWIILTLMVDIGETADLAAALAMVIASSVVLTEGPSAISALGISTSPGGK